MSKHYIYAFWITLLLAIVLIITGFLVPPVGVIDGSILTATGELFLWPALAFGAKALAEGKTVSVNHGDTTIEVRKEEEDG